MKKFIKVIKNGQLKDSYFLSRNKVLAIGRSRLNDIQLSDPEKKSADNVISRFHAAIIPEDDDKFLIQDLGSRNGTYIGSTRVDYWYLNPGDSISIGNYILKLKEEDIDTEPNESTPIVLKEDAEYKKKTRLLPNLHKKDMRLEVELSGNSQMLGLLYSMFRTVAIQKSFERACEIAVRKLSKIFQMERAFIVLINSENEVEKCIAQYPEKTPVKISRTLLNIVTTKKEAVIVEDVRVDERLHKSDSKLPESIIISKTISAACYPLISKGQLRGMLYLDTSKEKRIQSKKEQDFLSYVAQDLSAILENQLTEKLLLAENRNMRESSDSHNIIVGKSFRVKEVLRHVEAFGKSEASIFIQGETGTGKGLIAQNLHNVSPRKDKPFIEMNCANIPKDILESILFGHKKGAFTGAISDKKGRIELANGGTLFLDEIGEMSPIAQASLLKCLENQEIWPVGATEPVKINTRIIAATNKDIEQAMNTGEFRKDLYYRLSVCNLRFPPLRERKEDIPLLAGYFLARLRSRYGDVGRMSYEGIEVLMNQDWPGNLRELRNTIERAVILAQCSGVKVITPEFMEQRKIDSTDLKTLSEREKEYIIRVLNHTDGNKEKAYKLLGISRATLFNKINEYGLREFEE